MRYREFTEHIEVDSDMPEVENDYELVVEDENQALYEVKDLVIDHSKNKVTLVVRGLA